MLQTQQTQEAILPDPLNEDEVAERVARILRGCGNAGANKAYARFYNRRAQKSPGQLVKDLQAEDLKIDISKLPRTLRSMNRRYPEFKNVKGGFPPGYPVGKGPLAQMEWCQKMSLKIEVQRAQAEQLAALKQLEGYEATDGLAPRIAQT